MKIQSIDKANKVKKGRKVQKEDMKNEENRTLRKEEEEIDQKNADTVQFCGTIKNIQNEIKKIELNKTLRCNFAAQFKKGVSERGIVP